MSTETFTQKVAKIQKELKAPKGQTNKFGNYRYRSCEDILEAVKPLLGDLVLTISDEMVEVGGRVYVKATATLTDGVNSSVNTAYAREPSEQKGMSESQLTGTASSYARKYCLNGTFLIDDTKDADTDEYQRTTTNLAKTTPPKFVMNAPKTANPDNTLKSETTLQKLESDAEKLGAAPSKKPTFNKSAVKKQVSEDSGDLI